ncbi:hypothetical protein SCLCIDRAFT_1225225 [Scleroderma citrinum Foug A]|uniref:Uncharacterized protein n=1 Tax=Scleroderma citrinum Foug A TaxID=1036808 RepID=A0A0C2YLN8_9AGAM|nr:hypothetical protein SCLCIDRAFT_1225225 [Scleroderma citrinum Foug A]
MATSDEPQPCPASNDGDGDNHPSSHEHPQRPLTTTVIPITSIGGNGNNVNDPCPYHHLQPIIPGVNGNDGHLQNDRLHG